MSNIILPSSDSDKERIKGCMEEISNSYTRMEAEREFINEAIEALADDVDVPKKYLNKLAKIFHKQNLSETVGEMEDVEALYETVLK
jgi:hypothetical protein